MSDFLPTMAEMDAKDGMTTLEPDSVDLHHAGHQSLPRCPHCGSWPLTSGRMRPSNGVYQYTVMCTNYHCNATLFQNAMTREDARNKAIEQWSKRKSLPVPDVGITVYYDDDLDTAVRRFLPVLEAIGFTIVSDGLPHDGYEIYKVVPVGGAK